MTEKSLFISSCTRRELARRRPLRGAHRLASPARLASAWPPALLVAVAGAAAFIAGRGGI